MTRSLDFSGRKAPACGGSDGLGPFVASSLTRDLARNLVRKARTHPQRPQGAKTHVFQVAGATLLDEDGAANDAEMTTLSAAGRTSSAWAQNVDTSLRSPSRAGEDAHQ